MVSKASDDLPEPLRPVMTVSVLRGISTLMFFRLCWRAPRTLMLVRPMGSSDAVWCSRNSARGNAQFYSRILVANIQKRQREVKLNGGSVLVPTERTGGRAGLKASVQGVIRNPSAAGTTHPYFCVSPPTGLHESRGLLDAGLKARSTENVQAPLVTADGECQEYLRSIPGR